MAIQREVNKLYCMHNNCDIHKKCIKTSASGSGTHGLTPIPASHRGVGAPHIGHGCHIRERSLFMVGGVWRILDFHCAQIR